MARKVRSPSASDVPSEQAQPVSGSIPPTSKNDTPTASLKVGEMVRGEAFRTIYSNHSRVGITQWDFMIIFGQAIDNQGGGAVIEEEVAVKFSPQFFKALVVSLSTTLQQWEATFGEISSGLGQEANPKSMDVAFERLKSALTASEGQQKGRTD